MERTALGLVAAAALLLLLGLGDTDLWAPDEPRIAQVAEELRSFEHGTAGLVLLHANGAPYTQKPPLYYWLAAAVGAPLGRVSELAARLPSALAGVGAVALTIVFGRALFADARVGVLGAALLLTVFRFAHLARRAQFDVLLTLLEGLALLAFWRIETGRGARTRNLVLLHSALGLAVLTKGPVGLLPLAGIAAYLVWEGRSTAFRSVVPWWSWLLSIGPALVWLSGAVALAPTGFFGEAIGENVFGRFFAGTSHARPFYYYATQFPVDFLPWTLLWPLAIAVLWRQVRSPGEDRGPLRLLVAWIAVCFVFFSLSAGKRGLYLLPVFPATALCCSYALIARVRSGSALRGFDLGALSVFAIAAALGAWIAFAAPVDLPNNPGFAITRAFGVTSLAIGAAFAAALAWAWRRSPPVRLAVAIAGLGAIYLAVFVIAYPAFDAEKSPRPVAVAALEWSGRSAPLGVYDQEPLVPAIAYYGGRRVVHFHDPARASEFAREPGHALIARARHRDRLAPDLFIADALRQGRRRLIVLTAAQPTSRPDTSGRDGR